MKKIIISLSSFFLVHIFGFSQPLKIISTTKDYENSVLQNSTYALVNLKILIPTIVLELKYATKNNFTTKKLYKKASTTYLRKMPAMALKKIQDTLKTLGLGIKIYDAYRPYEATKLMWELIKDERYVANPINGSGHNKGTSVDLTMVNLTTGEEVEMGTAFDNFTDTAHHTFTPKLNATIIKNRNLLKQTMEKFGFKALETEWWHYSWISQEKYDVLDLAFKQLKKLVN
jgi:zinc D-Ala-D-Ala dipeptidase